MDKSTMKVLVSHCTVYYRSWCRPIVSVELMILLLSELISEDTFNNDFVV